MNTQSSCCIAVSVLLSLASGVSAAVTTTGTVSPSTPFGSNDVVVVGGEFSDTTGVYGAVNVDGGSFVGVDRMLLGEEDESVGQLSVDGFGTRLTLNSSSFANSALMVGEEGFGSASITGGATVDAIDDDGTIILGDFDSGVGLVTVDGPGSRLLFGENIVVGDAGIGELTIRNGAQSSVNDARGSTAVLGREATGVGIVEVTGAASRWILPETTTIGVVGSGTLTIADGAQVIGVDGREPGITVGTRGTIALDHGQLFTDGLTLDGRLEGHGDVTGPITVNTDGELHARTGQKLSVFGAVTNDGKVNVTGTSQEQSEIEFYGTVTNNNGTPLGGRISAANGAVRFRQPITNDGVIASTGGDTEFHGEITNGASGTIAIGGGSHATFFDQVDVTAGTINIAAGATAMFQSDLIVFPGGAITLELDETSQQEGFAAPLQVLGELVLNDPINLSFAPGYTPSAGDSFNFLETPGGLSLLALTPFSTDPLPGGLGVDFVVTPNGVSAVVSEVGITGDYNGDGQVNAADYTVWRNSLGQTGADLAADGEPNGIIDRGDYFVWRDNYGNSIAGSGSAVGVPEPGTLMGLLAMCFAAIGWRRR